MRATALLAAWAVAGAISPGLAPVAALQSAQVRPVPPVPPRPPTAERRGLDGVQWTRSGDGSSLRIAARGRVEFTDDERDVSDIIGNGYLEISEQGRSWFFRPDGRRYIVRRVGNGELSRRFIVNGGDQPMDEAARTWIGDAIQLFVRESGFNVDRRVARILAAQGATGVLDEIARIPGDFVQATYYRELARQAPAEVGTLERALRQAGRDIGSDFELARTLITLVETVTIDDRLGAAFVEGTAAIGSDFEHARVLLALLGSQRQTGPVETIVLQSIAGIQSDFEMQRVLSTLAARRGLAENTVVGLLRATSSIGSDFEKARVLLRIVASQPIGPAAKPELANAVERIGSDHERGRVLSEMLRRGVLQ
jgi:hypothetical protein